MGRKAKWCIWTGPCSGCFEFNEGLGLSNYKYDYKAKCYIGAGCSECGYTGKRKHKYLISDLEKLGNDEQIENYG